MPLSQTVREKVPLSQTVREKLFVSQTVRDLFFAEHTKWAAARLKHAQNAYLCISAVFYDVFVHLADKGSSREGGRAEGKASPL